MIAITARLLKNVQSVESEVGGKWNCRLCNERDATREQM